MLRTGTRKTNQHIMGGFGTVWLSVGAAVGGWDVEHIQTGILTPRSRTNEILLTLTIRAADEEAAKVPEEDE